MRSSSESARELKIRCPIEHRAVWVTLAEIES
jgi:hypothetical protein